MRYFNKITVIMIILVLVGFVNAESFDIEDEEDISERIGIENSVAENVKVSQTGKESRIEFSDGFKGKLVLNGNKFDNVYNLGVNGKRTFTSSITVADGKIIAVDFYTNGGEYVIEGQKIFVPSKARVILEKESDEVRIIMPEDSELEKYPETISEEGYIKSVEIVGQDISLPEEGKLVEGSVLIKEGELFVSAGEDSKIRLEGVEIINTGKDDIPLFFDGFEHDLDRYVSLSDERSIFKSFGDDLIVNPDSSNKLFKLEEDDHLAFKISDGSMEISNRDIEGKRPLASVRGQVVVDNDYRSIVLDNGVVAESIGNGVKEIEGDFEDSGVSPIVFVLQDREGNLLRNEKFVITNSRGLFWADVDDEESDYYTYFGTSIKKTPLSRLGKNPPTKETFEDKTGIKLIIPQGYEKNFGAEHYQMLLDFVANTPEDLLDIEGIEFIEGSVAYAISKTKILEYPIGKFLEHTEKFHEREGFNEDSGSLAAFRHELTHFWDYERKNQALAQRRIELEVEGVPKWKIENEMNLLKYRDYGDDHVGELGEIYGVFGPENINMYRTLRDRNGNTFPDFIREPLLGHASGYSTRTYNVGVASRTTTPEWVSEIGEMMINPDIWPDLMSEVNPHYKIYRALPAWSLKNGAASKKEVERIYSRSGLSYDSASISEYLDSAKNDPWLHDPISLRYAVDEGGERGWDFLTEKGRSIYNSAIKNAAKE
tara:strand:- start:1094 stop:3232 length:2139 start_codon:yes stop_codon:yes gene_type:complete